MDGKRGTDLRAWPVLLVAAVFLFVAGLRLAVDDRGPSEAFGAEEGLLFAAGLIVLGVWIAMEVWKFEQRRGEGDG